MTTPCIYGTATGRSGGWLVTDILSVHSKVVVFTERVHFFRFVHGRYDPLTPKNVERMLHHQRLRLGVRFGVVIEVEPILAAIVARGPVTYTSCYEEIMRWLLGTTGKAIWGEYAPLEWRSIPLFLQMFPDGKAFHIYRDLRAVLASWAKKSFMPDSLYLNIIFNWIDSINHLRRYRELFPADRYHTIKFEDIHAEPERTIGRLCEFIGVPVEPQQLRPEAWPDLFDRRYIWANVSSHDRKTYYGFHTKLSENWRAALKPWQLALAEFLARQQLEAMGYACGEQYRASDLHEGLEILTAQPVLLKNLQVLLATGEGTPAMPNDPTDPRNWSAGADSFDKFVDTPAYGEYVAKLDEMEAAIAKKYAQTGNTRAVSEEVR
jgi:hypothetical protein